MSGLKQSPEMRLRDLEFGSLLGEGAFARVYHTQDKRGSREYAVKIVEKRQVHAQGRKNSVLSEKTILSSLDHPGIVQLYSAFQDDFSLYFVLELVSGGELAAQITRMGTCPLQFARYYTAEIVSILSYLQARRVAHRDLKPENLLLTAEGHLKLADFDSAVIVPEEGDADAAAGQRQGQTAFAGTALYLPPEVLLETAQPQDAFALDLWALGCILFQMLAGVTPFRAETEYLTFQNVLRGAFRFPEEFPQAEPRELVLSLLVAEPRSRPRAAELERHAFFGGSSAAFREFLREPPPPRASSSRSSLGGTFDFDDSSSEGTPEVGECFFARGAGGETSPRAEAIEVLPAEPVAAPVVAREPSWHVLADLPGLSWRHWFRELVERRTLLNGEDVAICGTIVQRRLPCLRPRVMVITDLPRLLVMDHSGFAPLYNITLEEARETPSIAVHSRVDFVLKASGKKFRCCDVNLGAELWASELKRAQSKMGQKCV